MILDQKEKIKIYSEKQRFKYPAKYGTMMIAKRKLRYIVRKKR